MGRKSNPRKVSRPKRQKTSSIEDLLLSHTSLDSFTERRYSPDSLRSLRKELKDAITQIYSKYIQRFMTIKDSRLHQDPLIHTPAEELIIEKNYCNELTQKVKQLVHLDSLTEIYYTFCKSVTSFASQINLELKHLVCSPLMKLACLCEAYQVMANSARELSKVTSGIFENQPSHITCENITKLAFFDYVMKDFYDLIEGMEDNWVVDDFKGIQIELKELSEVVHGLNKDRKVSGKNLLNAAETEKSLDEIVSFINGREDKKGNRRRRVSKASTAETSGSPRRQRSLEIYLDDKMENSMDKEIKEFQAKLESSKPLLKRMKPSLSEDWLKKIRSLIVKN